MRIFVSSVEALRNVNSSFAMIHKSFKCRFLTWKVTAQVDDVLDSMC